jgi:hypothetical protein
MITKEFFLKHLDDIFAEVTVINQLSTSQEFKFKTFSGKEYLLNVEKERDSVYNGFLVELSTNESFKFVGEPGVGVCGYIRMVYNIFEK